MWENWWPGIIWVSGVILINVACGTWTVMTKGKIDEVPLAVAMISLVWPLMVIGLIILSPIAIGFGIGAAVGGVVRWKKGE